MSNEKQITKIVITPIDKYPDYFIELLRRVREIRVSEKRYYRKITDICAQCCIDYDPKSKNSIEFYQRIQNKLIFAVTGKTAAELRYLRANANEPNMGLTTWKNGPDGNICLKDTLTSKNYLHENEIQELERISVMLLDYFELQTEKQIPIKMRDLEKKLDSFLEFNNYRILRNAGRITCSQADEHCKREFQKYKEKLKNKTSV